MQFIDFAAIIGNANSQTDQNTELLTAEINGKHIPCFVVFDDNKQPH